MSMIQAATDSDNLKHKLALLILGAIVGVGTYQVSKTMFSPYKKKKKAKEQLKKIEKQIRSSLSGIQEQFLEKHSQRLMELVA